jgi:hypothetical protein
LIYLFDHISLCLRLMCFQVISMLSRRLKGKWGLRWRQGFHSTLSVLSTLRHHSTLSLHIGIIFHSYIICQRGRQLIERAYISLTSIRFWRFMPKGEKVLAQSKRTAHHLIFKTNDFQIGILLCSKGGESSIFKIDILKPSWTLRGWFHWGGVLF